MDGDRVWVSAGEAARLCGLTPNAWRQAVRRSAELRATRRRVDGRTWEYRRDVVEIYADRPGRAGNVD